MRPRDLYRARTLLLMSLMVAACGGTPVAPTPPPSPSSSVPLAGIDLETPNVVAGQNVRGTVTLAAAAPAGGVIVTLSSNDAARATVPGALTIPAGQTTANFTVTTAPSSQEGAVTISATTSGESRTVSLMVLVPGALARLELESVSMSGGQSVRATISLTSPAPDGGLTVMLSASSDLAAVPPSVTIAAGQTSATFVITTRLTSRDAEVSITATAAGSTRTVRLTIVEARLTAFEVNPTIVNGALPVRGTVTFSGPHSNPTLRMTSSNTSVVPPATFALTPQSNSFSITTRSLMKEATVTLTVDCCGAVRSTTLRVLPMLFRFQVPPESPMWGVPDFVDLTTAQFFGYWDGRNTGRENLVRITLHTPGGSPYSNGLWTLFFTAPNNGRLSPGFYANTKWTLEAGLGPGLDVLAPKDGCVQAVGQFEIFEAVYGPGKGFEPIGPIERFHAAFRRTCNADPNRVIFGEISVSSPPSTYP